MRRKLVKKKNLGRIVGYQPGDPKCMARREQKGQVWERNSIEIEHGRPNISGKAKQSEREE